MATFTASAMTHLLVVSDANVSRDWYTGVLGATVAGEYGGTSATAAAPPPDDPPVFLVVSNGFLLGPNR